VREILITEAARRWNVPRETLRAEAKSIVAQDSRTIGYGELVTDQLLAVEAQPESLLKGPDKLRVMGQSLPRVDIPGKVTGGVAYVQDLRLEGMLHARVVRPPSPSAQLQEVDTAAVEQMPGVVSVIRDGSFLAVVAEGEFQAISAMRALQQAERWTEQPVLPDQNNLQAFLEATKGDIGTVAEEGSPEVTGKIFEATFRRPYQIHGSIGPSCAVAHMDNGQLTVWSHTQGVYPDQ